MTHPRNPKLRRGNRPSNPTRASAARLAAAIPIAATAIAALSGCLETDAWLWDPSVVGRWENTPTITPVLDRIDVIERDTGEFVDPTPVRPEDLVPRPIEYRISPGDVLTISIFEFEASGVTSTFEAVVDNRGFIDLPRLAPVRVEGFSSTEVQQALASAIAAAGILPDPEVSITIPGQRQATFGIYGNIAGVGRYRVPFPEFRLLDAITDAGGIPPSVQRVFVIRQVSLRELEEDDLPSLAPPPDGSRAPTGNGRRNPVDGQNNPPSIDEVLERLTAPPENGGDGSPAGLPAEPEPGMSPGAQSALETRLETLANAIDRDALSLNPGAFQTEGPAGQPVRRDAQPAISLVEAQPDDPGQQPSQDQPAIDLPDAPGFQSPQGRTIDDPQADPDRVDPLADPAGEWEFIDGRWVRVIRRDTQPGADALPQGPDPLAGDDNLDLVTQRVIEVPTGPLLRGVARFNIVIRPGDLISVPVENAGFLYITGPGINQPGTYNISPGTRLTILRAIAAANGFSAIGIPERVDLTRMIGRDAQATIRLNVRAIAEGTAPDIVLKPDDLLNFGTSFWATPLAVIRNGFRSSYGFGFLLDRNFGNDVFGAPPTNVGGGG